MAPLSAAMEGGEAPFEILLRAHLTAAEAVAASRDAPGAERLWRGEDGEALAEFVADLNAHASLLGAVRPSDYAPVMTALMAGRTVRPRYGTHPRVAILGPLEARLQHADRLILAALNEGTWPPEPPEDPWMSREMRKTFGLPEHERRIGLAAHDFAQAFGAPEVVLLRAAKVGGQPTVPARWLERLATVLKRLDLPDLTPERNGATIPRLAWRAALDTRPRLPILARPAPRPPVSARPRRLSATRIETLMRDPYSIYARFVLDLEPLDPLEADLGAADKGTMIHKALDDFIRAHPDALPEDAADILIDLGERAFGADALARPGVRAFWWPRFRRIARWFVETEDARRAGLVGSHTEIKGTLRFDAPGGDFVLSAEADRIDELDDGAFVILDYKTGSVPTKKKVETLAAPQLVLEAAILRQGGFPGVRAGPVAWLEYWKLSGGEPAGEVTRIDGVNPNDLADDILGKLKALIAAYDDPETPYPSVPRAEEAPRFNDYAHLARIKEWMLGEGPAGGAISGAGTDHDGREARSRSCPAPGRRPRGQRLGLRQRRQR
jgi:ATP-dependent helicase/nuclease subunit B